MKINLNFQESHQYQREENVLIFAGIVMGRNICNNKRILNSFFCSFQKKSLSCISFSEKYSENNEEKGLSFFLSFQNQEFHQKEKK